MTETCEAKSFCSTRSSVGVPARYHKYDGWPDGVTFDGFWASLESARKFAYGIQGTFLPDEDDRERAQKELAEFIESFQPAVVKENLRFPRGEDLIYVPDPYWGPVLERVTKIIQLPCEDIKTMQDEWNNICCSCISNLRYFLNRESFERLFYLRWTKTPCRDSTNLTSQLKTEEPNGEAVAPQNPRTSSSADRIDDQRDN